MKITNKTGLPEAFRLACVNDSYTRGEAKYSVSDLVSPPRQVILTRRHNDELAVDAVDRLWAVFGQAVHHILERSGVGENCITEKRYYMSVDFVAVSGQVDLIEDGIIKDYKTTSAWTLVYGSRMKEWEERMNMYALLASNNGVDVKGLKIIALLRDWQESKALAGNGYPQSPVVEIELPLWEEADQWGFMREKVAWLETADKLPDDELLECTPEERWQHDDKWAVMKKGRKSAVKLCDREEDAVLEASGNPALYVGYRPGRSMRCERYCQCASVCGQWKEIQEAVGR